MFTERFFDSIYNDWTCYALPLWVLGLALICLRRWPAHRRVGASALFSAAVFEFFFYGSFSWFLRDGLKVGRVSSHGPEAVGRFLNQDFTGIVAISLLLTGAGVFLLRRKSDRVVA